MAQNQNVVQIIINAIDNTKSGLTSPITNLSSLTGALGKLNTFFAIGEAAATFFFERLISNSIEGAAKLEILKEKTGISTESLSTLGYAAQQSDLDMDQLAIGLKKLSTAMYQTEQGNYKNIATFQALGVSVSNTDGTLKSQEQVLLQVANAFSHMQDGAAKSAIAVQLFGKSGNDMIPFLNQGADGIAKLEQQARDLGLEMGGRTAEESLIFKQNIKQIEDAFTGMGNELITNIMPYLVQFTKELVDSLQPGQALRNILDGLVVVLSGTFKFLTFVFDSIEMVFKQVANEIAAVGTAMTDLFQGNFKQAAMDAFNGIQESQKITNQYFAQMHDLIYDVDNTVLKTGKDSKEAFDADMAKPAKNAAQAINELKKSFTEAHPQMAAYFTEMDTLSKKAMGSLKDLAMGGVTALGKAIDTDLSKALSDFALGTKSFGKAAEELFQSLLKSMVDYVAQIVSATIAQKVMGALGQAVLGESTAASVAAGGLIAGAWASPAALVSLATFGANAGPATAALVTTSGIAHGLASFDTGINYLPFTGPAVVHQGERIVQGPVNKDLTDYLKKQKDNPGQVVHAHFHLGDNELASKIIDLKRKGLIP